MSEQDSAMNPLADADPCVAEFLARHGIAKPAGDQPSAEQATNQAPAPPATASAPAQGAHAPQQQNTRPASPTPAVANATPTPSATSATAPSRPVAAQVKRPVQRPPQAPRKRQPADRSREMGALRQLRANSVAVSLSKSNQIREKLNEAARFLAISLIAGFLALGLAFFTASLHSFVFFAALISLVLGIICVYRSTLIMTRLHRIAKI